MPMKVTWSFYRSENKIGSDSRIWIRRERPVRPSYEEMSRLSDVCIYLAFGFVWYWGVGRWLPAFLFQEGSIREDHFGVALRLESRAGEVFPGETGPAGVPVPAREAIRAKQIFPGREEKSSSRGLGTLLSTPTLFHTMGSVCEGRGLCEMKGTH